MKSSTISAALLALAASVGLASPVPQAAKAVRDSTVEGVGMPMSDTVNYIFVVYQEGAPGAEPVVDAYLSEAEAADPAAVLGDKMVAKTLKFKAKRDSTVEGVGMPMSDTVNYIFVVYQEGTPGGEPVVDAYLSEAEAADPAAVLGDKVAAKKLKVKVKRDSIVKRDSTVDGVGMPMSDTVNYIFVVYQEGAPGGEPVVDAYLSEAEAADPAAVLGDKAVSKKLKLKVKRDSTVEGVGMPMSDTVNYIFVVYQEGAPGSGEPVVDAYLSEAEAADPAAVLGESI